jgi:hypothetical protein
MKQNRNALLLIPCCKQKKVVVSHGKTQIFSGMQPLRNQLLQHIRKTRALAKKAENQRGILNSNAPSTQAIDLYIGNFYKVACKHLRTIMTGQYTSIHILILSAFYGLTKPNERLKEYELQMGDTLHNGIKVYQFWQQSQLWKKLQNYIRQNNIFFVWSLLPDSLPSFPYHRVFNNLWRQLRNTQIQCFHVKVPGAGTGTGYKRAEWLVEILNANPNYLTETPFPPSQLRGIPKYKFNYVPC